MVIRSSLRSAVPVVVALALGVSAPAVATPTGDVHNGKILAKHASGLAEYSQLKVTASSDSCLDQGTFDFYTCTQLKPGVGLDYTNEITMVKASLERIGGSSVPINYDTMPYSTDDYGVLEGEITVQTSGGTLAAGRYELRITIDTPGKWECSEFNPDGCTWMPTEHDRLKWRFVYDGQDATYPLWKAPTTHLRKAKVRRHGAKRRVATGRVVGRIEQDDYTLTATEPLRWRKVTLFRKTRHGWRRAARGKTHRNGHFRLVAHVHKGQKFRWKVVVRKAPGSPGVSGKTWGRI